MTEERFDTKLDGPYDFARERAEAEDEARRGRSFRRINGTLHDADDVPDPWDL